MSRRRGGDVELAAVAREPTSWRGDCLALACQSGGRLADEWAALDAELGGALQRLIADTGFTAELEDVAVTRIAAGPVRWLMLLGLGRRDGFRLDDARRAGAAAIWAIRRQRVAARTLGLVLPPGDGIVTAVVEGLRLALEEGQWFVLAHRFKAGPEDIEHQLEKVELLVGAERGDAVERGRVISDGVILSRELVAAPSNVVGPAELVEQARALAAGHGLSLAVLDRAACEREGLGGFLAATRGSETPPALVHLSYRPAGRPRKRRAVVGLGLTHDPDGLARGRIDGMKRHKGAATSALGAAQIVAELRPDVEAHFVLPLGEKALGGRALRPGDLVTAGDGRTVEVNGRDGEARMMMADALVFAERLEVEAILDVATLEPSCVTALGEDIAALWSSDDALARELARAAEAAGEPVWRLPLHDRYRTLMRPPFADLRSHGPRDGEPITSALFLHAFVRRTPWAHLDISGPVWSPRVDGYRNAGATGFGVGTMVAWLTG